MAAPTRFLGYGKRYGISYGGFQGVILEMFPDFTNFALEFRIDGVGVAWVDGKGTTEPTVFVSTVPVNTAVANTIEVDIDDSAGKISFIFDGTTVGFIDVSGRGV